MYLNRWVMFLSFLIGLFGIWFTLDAFTQYRNSSRSFSQVQVDYVPESFRWLDSDYGSSELGLAITNRSHTDVTVDSLDLRLFFDGEFAGARYSPWDPLYIPTKSSHTVVETLIVSISAIQQQGSDAVLEVRGDMDLSFDGIDRPTTIRIHEVIGQVVFDDN